MNKNERPECGQEYSYFDGYGRKITLFCHKTAGHVQRGVLVHEGGRGKNKETWMSRNAFGEYR